MITATGATLTPSSRLTMSSSVRVSEAPEYRTPEGVQVEYTYSWHFLKLYNFVFRIWVECILPTYV